MAAYRVLLLLSFLAMVVGGEMDIMTPTKRCVATDVQHGGCQVCACKTDGVYHCMSIKCDVYTHNITDPSLPECAPDYTYRLDTLFCTCDPTGHWRAERCKERLGQMRPRNNHYTLKIGTNVECIPHHFYIFECNICVCGENGSIDFAACTNRYCPVKSKLDICNPGDFIRTDKELCGCSDVNYFIDRLCLDLNDETIQEVEAHALDSIIDFVTYWDDLRIKCKAFYTYKIDCSRCYCNEYGEIFSCEYVECERRLISTNLRSRKPRSNFYSLPVLHRPDAVCKPGVTYRYKCNSCYCSNARRPICTTMICLEDMRFSLKDLRLRQKKRNKLS